MRKSTVTVLLVALTFMTGCDRKSKKSEDNVTKPSTELGPVAVTPMQDVFQPDNSRAELQKSLPKDVPLYRRSNVSYFSAGSPSVIQLKSPDKKHSILPFYRRELGKMGWRFTGNTANELRASKGDRSIKVSVQDHGSSNSQLIAIQVR